MTLDLVSSQIITALIYLMEGMGVFIIAFGAIKAFGKYARKRFDFSDDSIKLEFAKALALGLEFKLGAEILKTLMIRTLDELVILGSIVILRVALTFVIHWEISSGTSDSDSSVEERLEDAQTEKNV